MTLTLTRHHWYSSHSAQHLLTLLTCPPHPLRKRASLRIIRTATATMVRIISRTPDRDEVGCLATGQASYTRQLDPSDSSLLALPPRRPRRCCALSPELPTVTKMVAWPQAKLRTLATWIPPTHPSLLFPRGDRDDGAHYLQNARPRRGGLLGRRPSPYTPPIGFLRRIFPYLSPPWRTEQAERAA